MMMDVHQSADATKLSAMTYSKPAASLLFMLFIPTAIIPLFLWTANPWTWVASSVAAIAVALTFLTFRQQYFAASSGLISRSFFRTREIPWPDIEAIGTEIIKGKYGPEAIIYNVYTRQQHLRLMFKPYAAGELEQELTQRCATVVRIDEDRGTFSIPKCGDPEKIREIVLRHQNRLRRLHIIFAFASSLAFVPYISWGLFHDFSIWNDSFPIAASLFGFIALSWSHWAAIWRLRG